nr:hypothetical protein [Tanacetum cinerariifolium]
MFVADRNGGRGGSISMMSGRGGRWFVIHLIDSNVGSGVGGGVVCGGGVILGVMSSSVGNLVCGANGVFGGDSRGVVRGVTLGVVRGVTLESLGGEKVLKGDDSFEKVRFIKQYGLTLIRAVLRWFLFVEASL